MDDRTDKEKIHKARAIFYSVSASGPGLGLSHFLRVFNTGAKMPLPVGSHEKRQVAKIVGQKIPEN